jgi:hypothetical protein
MAATVTGLQVAQHFLQRRGCGLYIPNADIGSLAAGSVTSVKWFRNGNYGTNHWRSMGALLWRPGNATGVADDLRSAGDLTASSGALAVDANWADTTLGTEDLYVLFYANHYQYLIDAINAALRDVYFQNEDPLSLAADAGFQGSDTSDWTASTTTFTKISTAGSYNALPAFIRSGFSNLSGADGYLTQEFQTIRGAEWFSGVLGRADIGQWGLVWRDVTNSADLGTEISTTEEAWIYIERIESVTSGASGTETVGFRLQGDGASDDNYFQAAWFYPTDAHVIPLSSNWDSAFKVPTLSYLTFGKQLATGVYDARSMQKREIPASDYDFLISRPGANPSAVQFHNNAWLRYPILIQGRRAHSDTDGPVTRVGTETLTWDLDLGEAATAVRFFRDPRTEHPQKDRQLAQAEADFRSLSRQFEVQGPAQRRRPLIYRNLV